MFVFHESEARKKNSRAISPGSFFFIINSDNSLPGGLAEQALCPACSAGTDNTSSLPLILSSQNNSLVRDVNFSRKSTPSALFFFSTAYLEVLVTQSVRAQLAFCLWRKHVEAFNQGILNVLSAPSKHVTYTGLSATWYFERHIPHDKSCIHYRAHICFIRNIR